MSASAPEPWPPDYHPCREPPAWVGVAGLVLVLIALVWHAIERIF